MAKSSIQGCLDSEIRMIARFYELFENPGSAHTVFWFGGGLYREWINGAESYGKGVRADKLTVQALWQLMIPQLMPYLEKHDQELKDDIENAVRSNDHMH